MNVFLVETLSGKLWIDDFQIINLHKAVTGWQFSIMGYGLVSYSTDPNGKGLWIWLGRSNQWQMIHDKDRFVLTDDTEENVKRILQLFGDENSRVKS